jgi:hypothetical protein
VLFNLPLSTNASIFGIIAMLIAIRYINSFLAVASLLAFSIAFYTEYTERLSFGKSTIVYALLLLFLLITILAERLQSNYALRYYSTFLKALQLTSMLALYVCGNIYIYRELGAEMISGKKWEELPSSSADWLFWTLTFSIPAYYILRGILNKKAIFLRTGLVLLIPAYLTYRYYYHALPIEIEFLLLGGILFFIAYFLTRLLKETRGGYTSRQIKESSGLEQIEALIIADTFAASTPTPPVTGGGSSGGGGATGQY